MKNINEMVYLVNECYNKKAFDYLYKEIYPEVKEMAINSMMRPLYNSSLEFSDFESATYDAFETVVKTFDYRDKKKKFTNYLFFIMKNCICSILRHEIKKSSKFFRNSISIDSFENTTKLSFVSDTDIDESTFIDKAHSEDVKEQLSNFLENEKENKLSYSIVRMKLKECDNQEITKTLNVNHKQIENYYYNFFKKFRKEFLNNYLNDKPLKCNYSEVQTIC